MRAELSDLVRQAIWVHDPGGAKRRVIPVRVAACERPGLLAGIVGIDLFGVPEPRALRRLQEAIDRALAGRAKPLKPPAFPAAPGTADGTGTETDAGTGQIPGSLPGAPAADTGRPGFPGRKYHVDVRHSQGVQIGDGNTQFNRW
jgi:hypothetical protein